MTELVRMSKTASGRVAVIELDRPPVNALSVALWEAIEATFAHVADDADVACAVLTAVGRKTFCGGADVHEFLELTRETRIVRQQTVSRVLGVVDNFPLPIIAAINGATVGGGITLASTCDIRLAASHAHFSLPEIKRGAAGGGGAFVRRLSMPEGLLRLMLYTGRRFTAHDMSRMHFIDEVLPYEELLTTALSIAEEIASNDRESLVLMKRAVLDAELVSGNWMEAYRTTATATANMTALDASREGIRDFLADKD